MSFRILRRFLTTAASDSKSTPNLSVPHAGWPRMRYLRKCAFELFCYTGAVLPLVGLCDHFASTRPKLKEVQREFLKDVERELLKDIADDNEVLLRRARELKRRIEAIYEEDLK